MKLNLFKQTKSIIDDYRQSMSDIPKDMVVDQTQEFLKRLAVACIYQRSEGKDGRNIS